MFLLANYLMWMHLSQFGGGKHVQSLEEGQIKAMKSMVDSGWDQVLERQAMLSIKAFMPWEFAAVVAPQPREIELAIKQVEKQI